MAACRAPATCQPAVSARDGQGSACLEFFGGRTPSQVSVKQKNFQEGRDLGSLFFCGDSASKLKQDGGAQGVGPWSVRPNVQARLFGPALFEASKLRVLFLGQKLESGMQLLPRIYTLTHSDVTAKLTLAISQEINKAQLKGWYSSFQRDEVVAEWKKVKGHMGLHVHCHISGGNFYHNLIASFRSYIFRKELPVVLEAFMHGDRELFEKQPELEQSMVWVYFHSNVKEYNKLECWGPLVEAAKPHLAWATEAIQKAMVEGANLLESGPSWPKQLRPRSMCAYPCECCSRHGNTIPLPDSFAMLRQEQKNQ